MRPEALARAHLRRATSASPRAPPQSAVEQTTQPGSAAGRPGRDPPRRRQGQGGAGGYQQARAAGQVGRPGHCPSSAGSPRSSPAGRPTSHGQPRRRATPSRPTMPRPTGSTWTRSARSPGRPSRPSRSRSPTPTGKAWSLAEPQGARTSCVLFFLGGKCAHCMQQLQAFGKEFEALKALNTEIVAVSTDDLEARRPSRTTRTASSSRCPCWPTRRSSISSATAPSTTSRTSRCTARS